MTVRRFRLSDKFIDSYRERPVPFGPVGAITFKRTYARRLDETTPGEEGTEDWYQTCRRVIEGMFNIQKQHCAANSLPWNDEKAQRTAKDAYERLFLMKWTPPGRGLWTMGSKFVEERGGAALNNCAFISTENIASEGGSIFAWMMDALMLGVGVGFDTLGNDAITIKDPGSVTNQVVVPNEPHNTYLNVHEEPVCIIADSREGWTESVQVLLDAFYRGSVLPEFIYDRVRPAGAPIRGFGGTSSGPGPLRELHQSLISLYTAAISRPITRVMIVDTENLIGRCVVAGNVRRSAALSLGDFTDPEFITMKDRKLHPEELEHHRWGSNNSGVASIGMDYSSPAKQCALNGEPGFIWLDNARTMGRFKDGKDNRDLRVKGFNPCVEMNLESRELCTLVETYPWMHDSYEDWVRTLKVAYLYGKTVTLTRTHWPETNAIMLKNRRIGLSISGFSQACVRFGTRTMYEWCDKGYQYVEGLDHIYSDWLCIPRSKRLTTIKPSGTVSLLNGSTPGMHWPISKYAIRRIVFAASDPLLIQLRNAGYRAEPSAYYPDSEVVEFPVETQYFDRSEDEVSMWEQLERAAQLQYYWSDNGVSVTIKFNEDEATDIDKALQLYETRLKAVSFLPFKNSGYVQMPYEPINVIEYELRIAAVTEMNLTTTSAGVGEAYCDGDKCIIPGR